MAVIVKSLAKMALPTAEGDVYTIPLNRAAIIKSIRLVNKGSGPATVNMFVRRATGGTSYYILPQNLLIPVGGAVIDETEITLEGLTTANGEDRIRGSVAGAGAAVDCVISGVERDQT